MAEPLLSPSDPDWAAFKAGDEAYYLNLAGQAIRQYCGWNLFPSETITLHNLRVGSAGIVMLPSLYVTDVTEVIFEETTGPALVPRGQGVEPRQLADDEYIWFKEGYVRVPTTRAWPGSHHNFQYGSFNTFQDVYVTVTMMSGYDVVPAEIKQVAYELVASTTEMPSGNVQSIQTPGFSLSFSQAPGLSLNDGQKDRLSGYVLSRTR